MKKIYALMLSATIICGSIGGTPMVSFAADVDTEIDQQITDSIPQIDETSIEETENTFQEGQDENNEIEENIETLDYYEEQGDNGADLSGEANSDIQEVLGASDEEGKLEIINEESEALLGDPSDYGYNIGEPNDTRATAIEMTVGEEYEGEIGSYRKYKRDDDTDEDYFSIYLERGKKYRIEIPDYNDMFRSTTLIVDLYKPCNGDIGVSYKMKNNGLDYCDYDISETGVYYFRFYNYTDFKTHNEHFYTIKVSELELDNPDYPERYDTGEPNDSRATATIAVLDEVYLGEIGSYTKNREDRDDVDYFSLSLEAGKTYRLEINGYNKEFANTSLIIKLIPPVGYEDSISYDMKDAGTDYYDYTAENTGIYYLKLYNYSDTKNKTEHYYTFAYSLLSANSNSSASNKSNSTGQSAGNNTKEGSGGSAVSSGKSSSSAASSATKKSSNSSKSTTKKSTGKKKSSTKKKTGSKKSSSKKSSAKKASTKKKISKKKSSKKK